MNIGFTPAGLITNPHVQTIWGRLTRPRRLVTTLREIVETPDGDHLVLDHLEGDPDQLFVLFHGLEGSSNSVYIQGLLQRIAALGASATAVNFRSCARDLHDLERMIPNRTMRLYHSGETTDPDFVLNLLRGRYPSARMVAFGGSLGGNALLKWLGEHPEQSIISAAATISVPYDLGAGAAYMERRPAQYYVDSFLRTLRRKAEQKIEQFDEARQRIDLERLASARTFREFDDAATAPLHGLRDADDYYDTCSSIHYLSAIRTSTLCISAIDDPFLPPEVLSQVRRISSKYVELVATPRGGHLGFVGGGIARPRYWAEEMVLESLGRQVGSRLGSGMSPDAAMSSRPSAAISRDSTR